MNLRDILCWAAGAPMEHPQLEGVQDDRILYLLEIDECRLVDLLHHHRLAHRFLHRFQQERPGWCSKSLLSAVMQLAQQAETHTHQQKQALQEILSALPPNNQPLVCVKGFTLYTLTGQQHHLRLSSDLDLFAPDPENLWQTLQTLGYMGDKLEGVHEFAKMARDDSHIELHTFFPVVTYPLELLQADLDPAHHPGCWLQTFPDVTEAEIHYDILLANATQGGVPEVPSLAVLDVTMSVFIFCVHLFKHYIVFHLATGKNIIKLVELAEIVELTAHPQFDPERFVVLIERFGGQDSVRFVGHLFSVYLGHNPLPRPYDKRSLPSQDCYPRWLSNWRCWVVCGSEEELLLPSDPLSVIQRLGANSIVANTEGPPSFYSAFANNGDTEICRIILHSRQDRRIPLRLAVTRSSTALAFTICLLESLREQATMYSIILRGLYSVQEGRRSDLNCWVDIKTTGMEYGPAELDIHLSDHEAGYKLHIGVPWSLLPRSMRGKAVIPLLLEVALQSNASLHRFSYDPIVLMPIEIIRS